MTSWPKMRLKPTSVNGLMKCRFFCGLDVPDGPPACLVSVFFILVSFSLVSARPERDAEDSKTPAPPPPFIIYRANPDLSKPTITKTTQQPHNTIITKSLTTILKFFNRPRQDVLTQIVMSLWGDCPACIMQHASGLAEGVAGNKMRTEAGKMPESLVSPIRNGLGVSNDRFGLKLSARKITTPLNVLRPLHKKKPALRIVTRASHLKFPAKSRHP